MMRQEAEVVALREGGKEAVVRFARSEMCGSCHACFREGENEAEVELPNSLHAAVGERVYIELHERVVLRSSLLAYGLPLLGLILGLLLLSPLGEAAAAAGGLALCALAFFLLRSLEGRLKKRGEFRPRMRAYVQDKTQT